MKQQQIWEALNQNWDKWDFNKDCYHKRKIRMFTTKNLPIVLNIIETHANELKTEFGENSDEYLGWQTVIKYIEKVIKKRKKEMSNFKLPKADAAAYFGGK